MKAMILAAGLGTRLKPLTEKKPKALVEVRGLPLIDILIHRLHHYGFTEIIINVHHFAEMLIAHLAKISLPGLRLEISREEDLLNTGGGLKKAGWFFDDGKPFLLHNVDVLTDLDYKSLFNQHTEQDALTTLAVRRRKTNRYFLFDHSMKLCGWESVNPPKKRITQNTSGELTRFSFMGIHVLSPKIFNHFSEDSSFSIVDTYLDLAGQKLPVYGYDGSGAIWLDVGKMNSLKHADQLLDQIYTK